MTEGVKEFLGHRAALGRSVAATGIDVAAKQQLKGAVNDIAACGAEMGQAADQGARNPRIGHQPTRESAEKTGSLAPARRER